MTAIGIGTRVQCIKEDWKSPLSALHGTGPKLGTKWTVNWMAPDGGPYPPTLGFAEWPHQEHCFSAWHFRPVDDGDDEIAILRAIADNPKGLVELPSREIEKVRA